MFARAEDRSAIEHAARAAGVPFAAVWLDAPEPVLVERVAHREADASDADPDVVRMQCSQWADDVRWPRVDATAGRDAVTARAQESLQKQTVLMNVAA